VSIERPVNWMPRVRLGTTRQSWHESVEAATDASPKPTVSITRTAGCSTPVRTTAPC
jgi:hypothetical protein